MTSNFERGIYAHSAFVMEVCLDGSLGVSTSAGN